MKMEHFQHSRSSTILRDQTGLSVLEAMVAIGILSIVSFAFISWASMYYKGISAVAENNEISNTVSKTIAAFGDDDRYCIGMLGGTSFSPANPDGTSLSALHFFDIKKNERKNEILKKGERLSLRTGVKVKDIVLKPRVQLGPNVTISDLELVFEKASGGPIEVIRSIPVHTTVEAGKVIKCSISPANFNVVNDRLCEVKYSGSSFYPPTAKESDYNPSTKDYCKDQSSVKWCKGGGSTTRRCGDCSETSSYRVAASPLYENPAVYACAAKTKEGSPIPPREYYSVGVISTSVDPSRSSLDIPTSTCKFDFAAGADMSSYTTAIKCIP